MEGVVAEIKSKVDLVELIGSYITVKKVGKHYSALCPFHQEKSPSFVISPERQMWYCFGACHEGGDVISFVMKWENITFYEALKELARRANIQLTDARFNDRDWEKQEILYKINNLAAEYFHYILIKTPHGKKAMDYLKKRELNDKIIETFQLGYAPDSWDSLLKFLKKKKFSEEDILRTGLIIRSERNKTSFYDRFRGRLIFPIRDIRDNLIGFSGRILTDNKDEPKYINTPETEIYHKRESLYGIHITKEHIKQQESVLLVEGEFDAIMPYQFGVGNLVAIKGSSVTKDHLRILKRFATKIILSLDADAAGSDAVVRAIREAEEMEVEVMVMKLKDGKDPDEAVRNNVLGFKESIKKAVPAYDFLLQNIREKYDLISPYAKKEAGDEIIPFLTYIKNPIVLNHYVRQVADMLQVGEESIKDLLARHIKRQQANRKGFQPVEDDKKVPEDSHETAQKYLLSYIFQQENPLAVTTLVFSILKPEDFTTTPLEQIAHYLIEFQKNNSVFDVKLFVAMLPAQLHPLLDDLYLNSRNVENTKNEDPQVRALLIKDTSLKKQIEKISRMEESEENDKVIQALLTQQRNVRKDLSSRSAKR
jgi:DNA primase